MDLEMEPEDLELCEEHTWTTIRSSGCLSEPDEYVTYCSECGAEFYED